MDKSSNRAGPRAAGTGLCLLIGYLVASPIHASSHREAPQITAIPRVDGTDFHMSRSYEVNRENFVTLLANYLPLQDAYGGPNCFDLEDDARYPIAQHVDANPHRRLPRRTRSSRSSKSGVLGRGAVRRFEHRDGGSVDRHRGVRTLRDVGISLVCKHDSASIGCCLPIAAPPGPVALVQDAAASPRMPGHPPPRHRVMARPTGSCRGTPSIE